MGEDIPFGIVRIENKLRYIDSFLLIEEAKDQLDKDYTGNEENLNHALMAIMLFGKDLILTEPFRNLYIIRGRVGDNRIKFWYSFKECLQRKEALEIAIKYLLGHYNITEETPITEHINDDPGETRILSELIDEIS